MTIGLGPRWPRALAGLGIAPRDLVATSWSLQPRLPLTSSHCFPISAHKSAPACELSPHSPTSHPPPWHLPATYHSPPGRPDSNLCFRFGKRQVMLLDWLWEAARRTVWENCWRVCGVSRFAYSTGGGVRSEVRIGMSHCALLRRAPEHQTRNTNCTPAQFPSRAERVGLGASGPPPRQEGGRAPPGGSACHP